MSDYENPYQSPETQIVPTAAQSAGVEFTVKMLQYLNEASPWLRFIGILGYIGAGFTAVCGLIGAMLGSTLDLPSDFGAGFGAIFLLYIPGALLIFLPAHFTFKFGQKIRNFKFTNSTEDLEEALKNNKSYWKFTGILYIISLALIPVMFIAMIIVGVAGVLGNLF